MKRTKATLSTSRVVMIYMTLGGPGYGHIVKVTGLHKLCHDENPIREGETSGTHQTRDLLQQVKFFGMGCAG